MLRPRRLAPVKKMVLRLGLRQQARAPTRWGLPVARQQAPRESLAPGQIPTAHIPDAMPARRHLAAQFAGRRPKKANAGAPAPGRRHRTFLANESLPPKRPSPRWHAPTAGSRRRAIMMDSWIPPAPAHGCGADYCNRVKAGVCARQAQLHY